MALGKLIFVAAVVAALVAVRYIRKRKLHRIELNGWTAIVLNGASGIGFEFARHLHRDGVHVAIIDERKEAILKNAKSFAHSSNIQFIEGDAANDVNAAEALEKAFAWTQRDTFDILVVAPGDGASVRRFLDAAASRLSENFGNLVVLDMPALRTPTGANAPSTIINVSTTSEPASASVEESGKRLFDAMHVQLCKGGVRAVGASAGTAGAKQE